MNGEKSLSIFMHIQFVCSNKKTAQACAVFSVFVQLPGSRYGVFEMFSNKGFYFRRMVGFDQLLNAGSSLSLPRTAMMLA